MPSIDHVAQVFEWLDTDYDGYLDARDIGRAALFKEALHLSKDFSIEAIN